MPLTEPEIIIIEGILRVSMADSYMTARERIRLQECIINKIRDSVDISGNGILHAKLSTGRSLVEEIQQIAQEIHQAYHVGGDWNECEMNSCKRAQSILREIT